MAACGSLQHIFEKPLPESPTTLLDSLSSWNQIKPVKPIEQSSFTEIFGELHFEESSQSSSPSPFSSGSGSGSSSYFPVSSFSSPPSSITDLIPQTGTAKFIRSDTLDVGDDNKKSQYAGCPNNGDIFLPKNYESLQLCTEGLGFESSGDVEDLKNDSIEDWRVQEEKTSVIRHSTPVENQGAGEFKRLRASSTAFPPPISCIGKSGKPWVCFKSYRHDGRFVLKEIRIPSQEFLHACREDGRLKLHFVQPNDEVLDGNEDEEEEYYAEDHVHEENEEHYMEFNESDKVK